MMMTEMMMMMMIREQNLEERTNTDELANGIKRFILTGDC